METAEPKVNPRLAAATFLPTLPQGKGRGLNLALMHPPALWEHRSYGSKAPGAQPQCQHLTVAGHDLSWDLTSSRELQSKERTFLLSHSSSRTHSLKVAFSILSLAVKPHKQFILKLDARGTATRMQSISMYHQQSKTCWGRQRQQLAQKGEEIWELHHPTTTTTHLSREPRGSSAL